MGIAGMSPGSLLLIFLLALLVFGPKRLVSLGRELGEAMRQFKLALDGEGPAPKSSVNTDAASVDPAGAAESGSE